MRILIIGGTNFMGPHVVRSLSEDGHEVTVFHRGQTGADLPRGVNEIFGDRRSIDELAYKERIDVEEALRRTVAWERANPPEGIDPKEFDYVLEDSFLNESNA